MGSGKSTLAPILTNTLGYKHIDIDHNVEHAVGKSVSEIFRDLGEQFFREKEHGELERSSKESHCVISLGGGTIARQSNLTIVKTTGILIYLKADVHHIAHRMRNKTDRPMLLGDDGDRLSHDELLVRINSILALREPFYRQADIIIETDEQRIGITVDNIVRALAGLIE